MQRTWRLRRTESAVARGTETRHGGARSCGFRQWQQVALDGAQRCGSCIGGGGDSGRRGGRVARHLRRLVLEAYGGVGRQQPWRRACRVGRVWDACRGDYAIWKTLVQKASGIGRDPYTKTIAATNEWWALELKARPQASKFRYAALAEEDKMEEVFDACCVTNEHARVPMPTYQGSTSRINLDDESGCEGDETQVTPRPNRAKGGKKRAVGACPYSPSPKMNEKWASEHAKNEAFVRMVDLFDSRNKRDATQVSAREEIHEMMAMVEADGGAPGSDVHFYASQLFRDQTNRDVFSAFKGHEPSGPLAPNIGVKYTMLDHAFVNGHRVRFVENGVMLPPLQTRGHTKAVQMQYDE
ncbi:uncharacterized protein LOC119360275 [Triticum dicoccoides]|uniref:uncharacterized protein LOC119360275 n=1 Tax=Triticum dicoccoides TaxID=85692 RepID=UPI00189032F4|nr:uncharacterized protein LOC119360275 [Triticum dicoccoides]